MSITSECDHVGTINDGNWNTVLFAKQRMKPGSRGNANNVASPARQAYTLEDTSGRDLFIWVFVLKAEEKDGCPNLTSGLSSPGILFRNDWTTDSGVSPRSTAIAAESTGVWEFVLICICES